METEKHTSICRKAAGNSVECMCHPWLIMPSVEETALMRRREQREKDRRAYWAQKNRLERERRNRDYVQAQKAKSWTF